MTGRACSSWVPSQGSSYYPVAWILKYKACTYSLWWCSRGIPRYLVSACTSMCWMWTTTPPFSAEVPFLPFYWRTQGLALASCPWMCQIKTAVRTETQLNDNLCPTETADASLLFESQPNYCLNIYYFFLCGEWYAENIRLNYWPGSKFLHRALKFKVQYIRLHGKISN